MSGNKIHSQSDEEIKKPKICKRKKEKEYFCYVFDSPLSVVQCVFSLSPYSIETEHSKDKSSKRRGKNALKNAKNQKFIKKKNFVRECGKSLKKKSIFNKYNVCI